MTIKNSRSLKNLFNRFKKKKKEKSKRKIKTWQAVAFLIGVNTLSSAMTSSKTIRKYYKKLDQAPWAPPSKIFGPVWLLNNILQVRSNVRLLNTPDYPNRETLLRLQGLMWLNYMTFTKVFAGLKSPILGLIWTEAYKLMSVASYSFAKPGKDSRIYWAFLPLSLWSTYASSLAWYQAIQNKDRLIGSKAPSKQGKLKVMPKNLQVKAA